MILPQTKPPPCAGFIKIFIGIEICSMSLSPNSCRRHPSTRARSLSDRRSDTSKSSPLGFTKFSTHFLTCLTFSLLLAIFSLMPVSDSKSLTNSSANSGSLIAPSIWGRMLSEATSSVWMASVGAGASVGTTCSPPKYVNACLSLSISSSLSTSSRVFTNKSNALSSGITIWNLSGTTSLFKIAFFAFSNISADLSPSIKIL